MRLSASKQHHKYRHHVTCERSCQEIHPMESWFCAIITSASYYYQYSENSSVSRAVVISQENCLWHGISAVCLARPSMSESKQGNIRCHRRCWFTYNSPTINVQLYFLHTARKRWCTQICSFISWYAVLLAVKLIQSKYYVSVDRLCMMHW